MKIRLSIFALTFCLFTAVSSAQVDPDFHCYLLFGQSNMAGGGAGVPIGGTGAGTLNAEDCDTSERVKVLAFCDCRANEFAACPKYNQSRTTDKWYTAYPPLHICNEGVSPGDYFAKTLLDSIREDIKIGLIPCALSGQALTVFEKGKSNFNIPDWAHPTLRSNSPYDWMLARCKLAQQTGVIKGILLHQGESGPGGDQWKNLAKKIFDDLKKDLGLPDTLPVVVGELREGNSMNATIDQFAESYPRCGLASSNDAGNQSDDAWHFTPEGMRLMGKRYADAFLALSDSIYMPRIGSTAAVASPKTPRAVSGDDVAKWKNEARVFSLNGRLLPSKVVSGSTTSLSGIKPGNVYLITRNNKTGVKLMVAP
jgi:hypothetical protein